jgi:dTDP-4-amino-4,6-dideoxygalactose transaminase
MKPVSTIDLSYENQLIKADFMREFAALYDSNRLIAAPILDQLEKNLAAFCGTRHCCLTGAGTMALQLAAQALGIQPGDEVVVPANTFLASAVAMYHAGAKILLADVDPQTWNLSAATVREVMTPRTKAICLVHLFGNLANPAEFAAFEVPVIEDASHAFGGTLGGRRAGSLGRVAGFSAGPIKGFGGLGHAGFLTYDEEAWDARLHAYVNNGQTGRHYAEIVGHNFRIDTVNALFLQCKLDHWEHLRERRRQVVQTYDAAFDQAGIPHQQRRGDSDAVLWVYVIRVPAAIREAVMAELKSRWGIDTLVQYTFTINQLPIWRELSAAAARVPECERMIKEVISLPAHAGLTPEEAAWVAERVIETIARQGRGGQTA